MPTSAFLLVGAKSVNGPKFKLFVIRSDDIDMSVAFYRCLGVVFQEERHGSGPRHFAADLGGMIFEIYPTTKPEVVDRTTRLGFAVSDLSSIITALRELGTTIVTEPGDSRWGLRTVLRDPDGRCVELYADESAP